MIWEIILIFFAIVLWIIVGVLFSKAEVGLGIVALIFNLLLTSAVFISLYTGAQNSVRGKVSDIRIIEKGRIYKLVGQFSGFDNKTTGLVLDDGGDIIAVWIDQPVPAGVQYFQKRSASKDSNEEDQLVPVRFPLPVTTMSSGN